MSDIFRELDEDMRRERMEKLWKKYGNLIIGLALVIVVGVAGWRGYQYFQDQAAQKSGAVYDKALQLARDGKHADAEKELAKLGGEASTGYRALARFRAAAETAQRDPVAGLAAWKALAGDSSLSPVHRDLAKLRAGMLAADTLSYDQLKADLEPIASPTNTFRHSVRELLGVAALKAGKMDEAAKWFDLIVIDKESPTAMRQRAEIFQGIAAGGAAK